MAIADNSVQLMIREFEEAFGLSVAVALQTGGAKNRIGKGNGDWGVICPHCRPRLTRLKFGFAQSGKKLPGTPLEKIYPTFEPLASRHLSTKEILINFCNFLQVIACMLLHLGLLFGDSWSPQM